MKISFMRAVLQEFDINLNVYKPNKDEKEKIENTLGIRMDKMVYNKDHYENFKTEFHNKGCVTMKDWLKIYNSD